MLKLENEDQLSYDCLLKSIRNIELKGRSAGVFLILVRQGSQPLPDFLEDNLTTRVSLEKPKGIGSIFIDGKKKKFQAELVTENFFSPDC
ncbi:hypothetical protein [Enterococcus faecium]|uniref:hypothetical protein n=1 Tax=Enterococcus faecium TaxID=1352 RepID=UPI0012906D70|nr:hypothetical protein [Enterococcus faecium]